MKNFKEDNKIVNIAVIIHPLNRESFMHNFYSFYKPISYIVKPIINLTSQFFIKEFYSSLPPHRFMHIKEIKINDQKLIGIIGIICPLFPEQMIYNEKESIRKILNSALIARDLGAKIIALAGFTSIVGNQGEEVIKNVDVAVTSGNTLTASLCIEGIFRAAEIINKNLARSTATIIGATGDIGSACSILISRKVKNLVLCARNIDESSSIVQKIRAQTNVNIELEKSARKAVRNADIVLTATSSFITLIEIDDLKRGAILCDVSMPPNIARDISSRRNDVFIFEGGRAQFNFFNKIKDAKWKLLFPKNSIYGCLAEAFALALEGRFESFSLGRGNITEQKMSEINLLAKKNGINLSDFYCGDKRYTYNDIEKLRQINKY